MRGGGEAELKGLDAIVSDIEDVANLPSTLMQKVNKTVNEAINKAESGAMDVISKTYDETIGDPLDKAYKKTIGDTVKSITGADINLDKGKKFTLPVKKALSAGFQIIKILVSVMTILCIISLVCLKVFQTVFLLVLFLVAPLVFVFMILPGGYKIVTGFFNTTWSIMAWNIAWALCIKVYFIALLIVTYLSGSGINNLNTSLAFHNAFLGLAVILLMTSISVIVGLVSKSTMSANVGQMQGMITGFPRMIGSMASGAAGVVGGVASLAGGAAMAAGAVGYFASNPKGFMSSIMSAAQSAGGMGSFALNRKDFMNNMKKGIVSEISNPGGLEKDRWIKDQQRSMLEASLTKNQAYGSPVNSSISNSFRGTSTSDNLPKIG